MKIVLFIFYYIYFTSSITSLSIVKHGTSHFIPFFNSYRYIKHTPRKIYRATIELN